MEQSAEIYMNARCAHPEECTEEYAPSRRAHVQKCTRIPARACLLDACIYGACLPSVHSVDDENINSAA